MMSRISSTGSKGGFVEVTFEELNDDEFGGYLLKRGRGKTFSFSKPWSSRFIVVNKACQNLRYYEERGKWRDGYAAKDLVSLEGAQISEKTESDSGKEFSFQVTVFPGQANEEILLFSSVTETYYHRWLDALRELTATAGVGAISIEGSSSSSNSQLSNDVHNQETVELPVKGSESISLADVAYGAEQFPVAQALDSDVSPSLNSMFRRVSIEDANEAILNASDNKLPQQVPSLTTNVAAVNRVPFSPNPVSPESTTAKESPKDRQHIALWKKPMDAQLAMDLSRRSSHTAIANRESILTRTDKILAHRRARTEAHKLELEEEIKQIEASCHPKITKLSQGMSRNVDDMYQWERERKERLKHLQDQIEKERNVEITGKPVIRSYRPDAEDTRSEKFGSASITCGSIGQGSSTDGMTHFERMHKQHELRQAKLQQEIDKKEAKMKEEARPVIFPPPPFIAANIEIATRGCDVGDRLYKVAEEQKRKSDIIVEERHANVYDDDGYPRFEPRLNETSYKIAETLRPQNIPIQELLHYHGQLYEQKAQLREAQRLQEEDEMRQVKLNPVTAAIVRAKTAAAAYENEHGSISDASHGSSSIWDYEKRLLKPTGTIKKSVMLTVENHSFHPKINAKSAALMACQPMYDPNWQPPASFLSSATERMPSTIETTLKQQLVNEPTDSNGSTLLTTMLSPGRFSMNSSSASLRNSSADTSVYNSDVPRVYYRSQMWAAKKAKDTERERTKRAEEELKECSFKPKIRSSSAPRIGGGVMSQKMAVKNAQAISEKNAAWKKKRDDYLEAERRRKVESSLQECTFRPFVPTKGRTSLSSSAVGGRNQQAEQKEEKTKTTKASMRPAAKLLQERQEQHDDAALTDTANMTATYKASDEVKQALDDVFDPATEDYTTSGILTKVADAMISISSTKFATPTPTPTPPSAATGVVSSIDDHPYYSEELFLNSSYITDMDEMELPPPPPPKTPPPAGAQFKLSVASVNSPVPARQPLVLKMTDYPNTGNGEKVTAGRRPSANLKKIGLDPDERRRSIERKVADL